MPCNDISEFLRIEIDQNDRLKNYHFSKRTCGGAVGDESLLSRRIEGISISEFLALDAGKLAKEDNSLNEIERYIEFKHLFAIRSALEALTGDEPGGPDAVCAIDEISFDGETMIIDVEIRVVLVTEKIKSCLGCGCDGRLAGFRG